MDLSLFFRKYRRMALAFSGGVDSAYLLYAALSLGCDIHAYYVKSPFQPQFELSDAHRLTKKLHAQMTVINLDILSDETIVQNPANRCYYCKKLIFTHIAKVAALDGYKVLIDGTNASDDAKDRPGMQALKELSVLSPLKECGLTKDDIRRLSKDAGLFTWDKPAYACLATRIPTGTIITKEKLMRTELAEKALTDLGFSDIRIRMIGEEAKIQIPENQFDQFFQNRHTILKKLKLYYPTVMIDLEGRIS